MRQIQALNFMDSMLRIITLICLITLISGCSWISRDYYYQSAETSGWSKEFRPGKTSTKAAGYPDSVVYTLNEPDFELQLSVSYQNVVSVGPLIFPIFPTFSHHDGELRISAQVTPESAAILSTKEWRITELPSGKVVTPNNGVVEMEIAESSNFQVVFPVQFSEVASFTLDIGTFNIAGKSISPPALQLTKEKGTWHFEQFTL